jgi:hypothetical protein
MRLFPLVLAGLAFGSGAAKIKHHRPASPVAAPAIELEAPPPEPEPPPPPAPPARVFGAVPTPQVVALPQVAEVSGRIIDGEAPLTETEIEIDSGRQIVVVTTDVDGRFAAQLPPGVHTIRISGENTISFNASAGQLVRLESVRAPITGEAIPDAVDRCPDDPESINGYDDNDGCPEPANRERSALVY